MQFRAKIKTNSAQVASIIKQAVISGELRPGIRLREAELSESLGVSRSPIREAFRILESEGLVQISPNKGVSVTQLTEKDLREIYELRILLEVHGLRQACKNMAEEHFKGLEILIGEMEKRIKSKDYIGYFKTSHEFHEFYMKQCENERLFNLFTILKNTILAVQIFAYSYPKHSTDSMKEHRKVFSALLKRDPDSAEAYLREHLESGYERAKRFLKTI